MAGVHSSLRFDINFCSGYDPTLKRFYIDNNVIYGIDDLIEIELFNPKTGNHCVFKRMMVLSNTKVFEGVFEDVTYNIILRG